MATPLNDIQPELQRQRLAVYSALGSVLSEEQAAAALDSWPNYLTAGGSAFNGLHAFARDICLRFNITAQQRDLVRALNRALLDSSRGKDVSTTLSDKNALSANRPGSVDSNKIIKPGRQAEQSNQAEETTLGEPIETADFQTFQALMNALLQLVENNRPGLKYEAVYFLNEVVTGMPWSQAQQQQMMTLLATGSAIQTRTYQLDHLKTFLHHFRSWMVDEMGANVSGNVFNHAIKETEKTLSGIKYPPDNFL